MAGSRRRPVENGKAAKHRGSRRARRGAPSGAARFIKAHLQLAPVPTVPEILLFAAHEGTALRLLLGDTGGSPYWAFPWAGGLALARHILDRPELVAGRAVLDLGAGSGLVAIAAANAGASAVSAADIDPVALAALKLNAIANRVAVAPLRDDLLGGDPPAADIVLVGDLFY